MALALPPVFVTAETLPEAWEKAVLETWEHGEEIPTQYDKEGDPPSRDASAWIVVTDPFKEPRIHNAMPAGYPDLERYRLEVCLGIRDHWIDPKSGKWSYTYHERLTKFRHSGGEVVNQLDYIVDLLSEVPHSRRAQATLWKPGLEETNGDPPCLQRIWCRIFGDKLVMNVSMRSNDAFKAAFMNMYAFTELQRELAARISEKMGRRIEPGQYTHFADSFHIYGSYFRDFRGFLTAIEKRPWEARVAYTTSDVVQDSFREAREEVRRELQASGISMDIPD